MLIIIAEIITVVTIVNCLKRNDVQKIYLYIFFAFVIQIFIFIVYRIELFSLGREVYYSDAETYWYTTLSLLNGYSAETYNMGYVYYSYLIEITSPFIWVGFINISNTMLINIAVLIIAYMMQKSGVEQKNTSSFIVITMTNPLIIYAMMRNLKDALFLFYASLIILCFFSLESKKNNLLKFVIYVLILIFTLLISSIRPWGFLIPISLFLFMYFNNSKEIMKKAPLIFIVRIISIIFIFLAIIYIMQKIGYIQILYMWVPIVFESASSMGIISLILAPLKILTGPGPIRSIFGSNYFLFYTESGNIFSAIGALFWWLILGIYTAFFITQKKQWSKLSMMLIIIFIIFITIYSMQYGGSLELRFRGVIYILTSAIILTITKIKTTKVLLIFSTLFTLIISAGGIIFGM